MIESGWPSWLEWFTAGLGGFVTYWAVLLAIAGLELARPGPLAKTALGPRLTVNLLLGFMAAVVNSIPAVSLVAMATVAYAHSWGVLNQVDWPLWLEVLASFLLADLTGYAIHRASHRWPVLWRLHRVHHSDPDIDLSTIFRAHPASILVVAGLNFIAIVALGLHPLGIMLHGLARLVTMGLGHANVAAMPGLSRTCGLLFVTPEFHRRHHSAWQPETDSNYGEVLTLWDRCFRSHSWSRQPVARFGLGDTFDHDAAALLGQLTLPFISR